MKCGAVRHEGDKKMTQLTKQEIEMANRMAASMLADGVTPEMFIQSMDAFTQAYMAADTAKIKAMTEAYFTRPGFRADVIMATAEMNKPA